MQQTFRSSAVAGFVTEKPSVQDFAGILTQNQHKMKKVMHKKNHGFVVFMGQRKKVQMLTVCSRNCSGR